MIRRLLHRIGVQDKVRSLEAAGGGRRWRDARTIANLNDSILAGGRTAAQRAAYAARNNPYAAAAVQTWCANLIGSGIKPQSQHPAENTRSDIERRFARWSGVADYAGLTDWAGLQLQAARSLVEDGEAFIRLRLIAGEGLRLEQLHPSQVPADLHREMAGGARIRAGVEYDARGRRVAYHIYRERPGDAIASIETVRIPATDMLHILVPLTPGQVRGLSWLAPVLTTLRELDGYQDATIVKAKVEALFAAFVIDPEGQGADLAKGETPIDGTVETGMSPGTIVNLPPGKDVKFGEPKAATATYEPFVRTHLRSIATGLGVTYEQLTGDLTGVNYSSIRAGLIEFRRRVEQLQQTVVIHQLCRPAWERFIRLGVLAGDIPGDDLDAALAVKWVTPAWEWVDPEKDINAEVAAINAGLKSRSQAIGERGRDAETVDAEIAADNERASRLGLAFQRPATEPSNA